MTTAVEACRVAAGRFIVLEGIDGSGTTTQGHALVAALERAGVAARFTHEPSAGPLGRLLRQFLKGDEQDPSPNWDGLALLFAADRLDHLSREVLPALAAGIAVVCDRYDLSSVAYQSATAPAGESVAPWIRAINQRARRPDLTIVLNVDAAVAERRRLQRGEPAELFEHRELQRRLAELYASAEQLVPGDRIIHLNADAEVSDVTDSVLQAVAQGVGR